MIGCTTSNWSGQRRLRKIRRLYHGQLLPFQMMLIMGIPFMIGVAMIIYGLTQYEPTANWRLVTIGFMVAMATAAFKLMLDRDSVAVLQRVRDRLVRINQELDGYRNGESAHTANDALRNELAHAERDLIELQNRITSDPSYEATHLRPVGDYEESVPR